MTREEFKKEYTEMAEYLVETNYVRPTFFEVVTAMMISENKDISLIVNLLKEIKEAEND